MSKRVRGAPRPHRRPGARPPSERSAARQREPGVARESQLEIAEVVAEDVVEDQPEEARTAFERAAPRARTRAHHNLKADIFLAPHAATEYVYVAQDMRRILLVAGGLIGLLFAIWLLIVVFEVIPLPFY
ncbi:MAG: hypothetical protein ACR2H0_04790 [Candidatus Limnocylindrales bacterium]